MTAKDQQRLSSPGFGTLSPSLLDDLIQVHLLSISNRSCPLPMSVHTETFPFSEHLRKESFALLLSCPTGHWTLHTKSVLLQGPGEVR